MKVLTKEDLDILIKKYPLKQYVLIQTRTNKDHSFYRQMDVSHITKDEDGYHFYLEDFHVDYGSYLFLTDAYDEEDGSVTTTLLFDASEVSNMLIYEAISDEEDI